MANAANQHNGNGPANAISTHMPAHLLPSAPARAPRSHHARRNARASALTPQVAHAYTNRWTHLKREVSTASDAWTPTSTSLESPCPRGTRTKSLSPTNAVRPTKISPTIKCRDEALHRNIESDTVDR